MAHGSDTAGGTLPDQSVLKKINPWQQFPN